MKLPKRIDDKNLQVQEKERLFQMELNPNDIQKSQVLYKNKIVVVVMLILMGVEMILVVIVIVMVLMLVFAFGMIAIVKEKILIRKK